MTPETTHPTGGFNAAAREVHEVDPDRLDFGRWDASQQKHVGEGDIHASYSADRIAVLGQARTPFTFQGQQWVCTGNRSGGGAIMVSTAYRLVLLEHFKGNFPGEAVSYAEKTDDSAAARADPDGFYHGIKVQHRNQTHVMVGPPVHFVPGAQTQPGLFAGM